MRITNLQIAQGNRARLAMKRRGRRLIRLGLPIVTKSDVIAVAIARGAFPGVPVVDVKVSAARPGDLRGVAIAA